MFGQSFESHDLIIIALLIVLEGVLSIDNALVLGLLARRLPREQQGKALTYGLVGAFAFRFIAIATAAFLLKWTIFKLLGGAYLVWVSVKHFFLERRADEPEQVKVGSDGLPELLDPQTGKPLAPDDAAAARSPINLPTRGAAVGFWSTVFVIELTDIAFAVDSIVAAIGVVGPAPLNSADDAPHPKLWVVLIGGFLGVVLMRFAAVLFIRLLGKFPRFETSAYLLVIVIGAKLVVDWAANSRAHPHRINFHNISHPEFWVFWILMLVCFAIGFIPTRAKSRESA